MLRVKTIYGGTGGGSDNSLWAEIFYPERGVKKPNNLLYKAYRAEWDVSIYPNIKKSTNTVLPEVLNTDTYIVANPFSKAVNGYTAVT